MSAILITGGAGFIGSHLTERLLKLDNRVIVLDDFNDYYAPDLKWYNLSGIQEHPGFTLIKGDIRECQNLVEIFKNHNVQRVVHLAARAGVRASLQNPLLYEDVNVRGTLNVLEACREIGIENLLIASSSSVYGNSQRVPFREDDPADAPISPYAATKRSVELLCHTYFHLYHIPITCFRFFTVYGPRQRPDMAIHTFVRQIISGQLIRMFGDGTTQRDYTFISDIIDGLVVALDQPSGFEIVNLGNSRLCSLSRLLNILQEVLKIKAHIEYVSEQPGDVALTHADISKATHLFGYTPKVSLETGIQEFAQWFFQVRDRGLLS